LLRAAHLEMARNPSGDRSRVGRNNCVVRGQLRKLPGNSLWLDWTIAVGVALSRHQLPPIFHSLLRLIEKFVLTLAFDECRKRGGRSLRVADKSYVNRKAQTDAIGLVVDLHTFRVTGVWQVLQLRKGLADDE